MRVAREDTELAGGLSPESVISTFRQHAGAALVAAAVVVAALAQGLFNPTGYAAASILIWGTVTAGLVARALPTGPVSRPAAAAGLFLAATAILAMASVGWASDKGRAFEEAARVSFFLGLFVLAACTAARGERRDWLAGLAGGLGIVSVIAVFAYLQPGVLDSGRSEVPNAAGRLAYPVGYWNGAGALMAVAAVLLAHAAVTASARAWRAAATAVIPLAVLGIWLTGSRASGAALVVGAAILLAASANRPRQLVPVVVGGVGGVVLVLLTGRLADLTGGAGDSAMRSDGDLMSAFCVFVVAATAALAWALDSARPRVRVSGRGVAIAGAVCIAAIGVAVVAADPGKRLDEFRSAPPAQGGIPVGASDLSSNGRWQFWGAAIDAFEADPIGGVGAGGFENWWARHSTVSLFVRNPHSLPLQQAAELGSAGLILFLGFVAALAGAAPPRLRAPARADAGILVAVVAAGAVGAAVDWTWEIPAVFGPVVVCAALLLASSPSPPLARDAYWLGIATVTAAWLAMVTGGLVVLTQLELDSSQSAAKANRLGEGIQRAEAAKTVQPWSSEPYTRLALLEYENGDVDQALSDLKEAQSRDSGDWRLWLIEANLLNPSGDEAGSSAAYQRAQSLAPVPLRPGIVGTVQGGAERRRHPPPSQLPKRGSGSIRAPSPSGKHSSKPRHGRPGSRDGGETCAGAGCSHSPTAAPWRSAWRSSFRRSGRSGWSPSCRSGS